jgi:16S rRNA (cytidine1402-2'-O)-methyltransferase
MSKLYLVPTPIGNLEDITLRAIRILKEVDLILAEDTRVTSFLCKHYNIETKIQSFHMHNEHAVLDKYIHLLKTGSSVALVSDAGTPGISDPGFLLVRACLLEEIAVECLPGATAFVPALIKSGFPTDRFVFEGFLPHKKGRQTRINNIVLEPRTVIIYESPHRLVKTLEQLKSAFKEHSIDRHVSVSRELTKMYEETITGTVESLITHYTKHTPKGEIVMLIDAYSTKNKNKVDDLEIDEDENE